MAAVGVVDAADDDPTELEKCDSDDGMADGSRIDMLAAAAAATGELAANADDAAEANAVGEPAPLLPPPMPRPRPMPPPTISDSEEEPPTVAADDDAWLKSASACSSNVTRAS